MLYCLAHDLQLDEQREKDTPHGRRNPTDVVQMRGLVSPGLLPIFDRLGTVVASTLTPEQAQAMAALRRPMVRDPQAGELEERLRDLEDQVQGNHTGGTGA